MSFRLRFPAEDALPRAGRVTRSTLFPRKVRPRNGFVAALDFCQTGSEKESRAVSSTIESERSGGLEGLTRIRHDILSPLGAASGFLELLDSGIAGDLNEQQKVYLQNARTGVAKAIAIAGSISSVGGGTSATGGSIEEWS